MMKLFGFLLFTFYFFLFAGCRPAAPVSVGDKPISINDMPAKDAPSRPLKPVGEMSWTTFDNNVRKLKDLRGKVVVLDFWATNCPPCIEEIPHLLELKKNYGDDLEIVGLHVGDDEDREKVPDFVRKLEITYQLAYPEDALTSYIFGQESAIPQTAVFGRDGRMMKKIIGFSEVKKKELDDAIRESVGSRQQAVGN